MALLVVGARSLEHLRHLAGDPVLASFCGLARIPSARTVSTWLRQFTRATVQVLADLNHALVTSTIARLQLARLTIDVDGSVVRTGAKVAWAFRGFNPHHRKDRSYYPLLAHLAQTGHILRLMNRPGNVHPPLAGPRIGARRPSQRFGRTVHLGPNHPRIGSHSPSSRDFALDRPFRD